MRRTMFRLASLLGCVALVALFSIIGNAQFRAGVQGVVTDGAGGTVPGATVTLTNKDTNQTQTTTTSDDGFYRFSALAPGLYSVSIEKADFKKAVVDEVKVDAEATKGQDITLEAGVISEVVTVEADNVALQTEDATIGKTITTEEVLQLPQQGRDPYELIRLTPGVFGQGARNGDGNAVNLPNTSGPGGSNNSIFQTENMVPISANGQRVTSNNFQIDGVSVNSLNWGGAAIVTPSQETVKEMQVSATTYSAEDGRNSGAQIKTITQNGTNDWHGSVFYKLNDPALNAFNKMPFTIAGVGVEGPKKVLRKFNSYGGSFGGPLPFLNFGDGGDDLINWGKDRLFFFVAYEGTRDSTNNPYYSWIETDDFRQRLFTARPSQVSSLILGAPGGDPRVLETVTPRLTGQNRWACGPDDGVLLNNMPATLVSGGLDIGSIAGTYGQYLQPVPGSPFPNNTEGGGRDGNADLQCALIDHPGSSEANQYFTRIDAIPTDKDRITFTGIFTPQTSGGADSAAQSRPQADFFSERLNFATALIYTRNISATMVNEARFSYSGWGFDELASNPHGNFGIPRVEVEAIWGGRLRWGIAQPGTFKDRQVDFRDTLTNVIGNHVLKIGGEFRRDKNSGGTISRARPSFSFTRLWNFANGAPIFESVGANINGFPTPDDTIYHSDNLAFFVQDDWKLRPNLTLNLGLRWEYFSPIIPDRNVISNLVLDSEGGLAGATIEINDKLTDPDYNNFGPQVGFAWAPSRFDSKLVIRGGAGIAYDRLANALLNNARRNPGGPTQLFNICCPSNLSNPNDAARAAEMNFALSAGGILGYPRHPLLGGGALGPNGLPLSGRVEIYGAPRELPNASVYRYSLEAQYELPWRTVATLGYSGSTGRNFVRIEPLHFTSPTANPAISAAFYGRPDVSTSYNALLSGLRTRFYKGLSLSVNYAFAKSLDNVSFEAPCACTNQSFPIDQSEEYGRSDFDVRHNFNLSAVWELPFFSNKDSWSGKLLGGWQLSTIVTYNTGFPWTARTGQGCLEGSSDPNVRFCDPRPILYYGTAPLDNSDENFLSGGIFPGNRLGSACNVGLGCSNYFLTTITGTDPLDNRPGVGRNTFFGPKYFVTDIAIAKRFGLPNIGFLGEAAGIDVRFNFFNVFNQLNFAPFGANSNPTHADRVQFGLPTNALSGRVGEFQIRFSF